MMFVISFTCLDRLLGNSSAQFLMNRLSGRVLGPTCKIFSNRAALSLRRLVGVTDSLVDDNVLRLISELEPPVTSTLPDRASFSESYTLLILKS